MLRLERCLECPLGKMKRVDGGGFPSYLDRQMKRGILIGTPDGNTFRPSTCSNYGQSRKCQQEIITEKLAGVRHG